MKRLILALLLSVSPAWAVIGVGCIGDSITFGFPNSPPQDPCTVMVANLNTFTGGTNYVAVNEGVTGSSSAQWLVGSTNLNTAISAFNTQGNVQYVLIMLGTNDAQAAVQTNPTTYQTRIEALIANLESNVSALRKVIINYQPYINTSNPGYTYGTTWNQTISNALLIDYQGTYAAIAAADPAHTFVGDTTAYTFFQANQSQSADGIHPTWPTGYDSIAGLWATAFENLFLGMSITSPTTSQVLSGFSGNTFTLGTIPSGTARVQWTCDAYPCTNPGDFSTWGTGIGGTLYAGVSVIPPFSIPINTFWWLNGSAHTVTATAYDDLGNTLATANQTYEIANNYPCSWTPELAVTTGTSTATPWSGQVSITATLSGTDATESTTFAFYLDGVQQQAFTGVTSGTATALIDTTQVSNNPGHVVAVIAVNTGSTCSNYPAVPQYNGGAGEWSAQITTANSTTAMELRNDAHDIFVAPSGTHTLTPTLFNADGSTGSATMYYQVQSGSCTLNVTTGSSTTVTAPSSAGNCQVASMAGITSETDGTNSSNIADSLSSTAYTFKNSDVGRLLVISSGGTNCTVGTYLIGAINTLVSPAFVLLNANVSSGGTHTGCHFTLGPTAYSWILANSTNPLPCYGKDGAMHNGPNSQCVFVASLFDGDGGFTDQPYFPGYGADLGGYNTVESSPFSPNLDFTGGVGQSSFTSTQTSYMSTLKGTIQNSFNAGPYTTLGCPNCLVIGQLSNLTNSVPNLYDFVSGTPSGWTPTGFQIVLNSMTGAGITFVATDWKDEINDIGQNPLQGPIQPGTGTIQNWLTSVTASGGTCTALTTTTTPGGKYSLWGSHIIISGSATANMNSTSGNSYAITGIDNTHFSFTCTGVANGTYNSSNDPGLTMQPIGDGSYVGSAFLPYTLWASLRNQANGVTGNYPMFASNAAQTNPTAIGCWGVGVCGQSLTVGGNTISKFSDSNDPYWSHGDVENYITARSSTNALITDQATLAQGGPEEGYWMRVNYGAYDPTVPLTTITQLTSQGHGFTGQSLNLTSTSGNTFTFTGALSPDFKTVIPGVSRMTCSGTSNSEFNVNFYLIQIKQTSPLIVTAALAETDFTGTITSGTATFAGGLTKTVTTMTASGTNTFPGDQLTYSGSPDVSVNKTRGSSVTFSGTGNTNFNTRTFWNSAENLAVATDTNGTPNPYINLRELPTGTSTGGSCNILADNNFIIGRNANQENYANVNAGQTASPHMTVMSIWEAAIVTPAGHRSYKPGGTAMGYIDHAITGPPVIHGGFTGINSSYELTWPDPTQMQVQLYSLPGPFENSYGRPMFRSGSQVNELLNSSAILPLLMQPRQNSPQYGAWFDTTARSGSNGALLLVGNFSEGAHTITLNFSPYLQSGQGFFCYDNVLGNDTHLRTFASGTSSATVTFQPEEVYLCAFQTTYAVSQPTVGLYVPSGATHNSIRFNYDPYFMDVPNDNFVDCGTAVTCPIPLDRAVGTIYYRVDTLYSSGVLAKGAVETF